MKNASKEVWDNVWSFYLNDIEQQLTSDPMLLFILKHLLDNAGDFCHPHVNPTVFKKKEFFETYRSKEKCDHAFNLWLKNGEFEG
jgi:hypothetical protein